MKYLLFIFLPFTSTGQVLTSDGLFAKKYSESKGIFFDSNTVVSKNNISIILEHAEPDIRCFNSKGQALNFKKSAYFNNISVSRSCGASLQNYIVLLKNDALDIDSTGTTLNNYTQENNIEFLDGTHISIETLPTNKYYVFYTYMPYNRITNTGKDSQEEIEKIIAKQMLRDFKSVQNSNIKIYYVCVTGMAFNGSNFQEEIKIGK